MAGKLDKERKRQELEKLKAEVPGLIERVKEEKEWGNQQIADYLNEKLKEKIPDYKVKTKSAIDKWLQKENSSDNIEENDPNNIEVKSAPDNKKKKSAPNNKEVKFVVEALNELSKPSVQEPNEEYETFNSILKLAFPAGIIRLMPQDLMDYWKKQYSNTFKNTFKLYNWHNTFSLLKLEPAAELKQELGNLDNSFPMNTRIYSKISILIPIAKEIEGGQGSYLCYAIDNTDESLGLYLWNTNGYFEFPLFIANSVNDLIRDHVITLEKEDNLHFDPEKYLNETFKKNMKGYIHLLNIESKVPHTHFEKMEEFYEKAFNRGTIKFEETGELITVAIKSENFKSSTYNIKDGDLFLLIGTLNDELNVIDKSNFCRPKYYGYYLISNKYIAYLRLDIATDLIQKGFINSQYKMLPMLAFYNPKVLNVFNVFRAFAEIDKQENQLISWI